MDNETLQLILTHIDEKLISLGKHLNTSTTIPIASKTSLGGIIPGQRLSIDANGFLTADTQTPSTVSTSSNGLMSAADKVKLDTLQPVDEADEIGGIGLARTIFGNYTYGGGE